MSGGRHTYQMDMIEEANQAERAQAGLQESNTADYNSAGMNFAGSGVDPMLGGMSETVTSTVQRMGMQHMEGTMLQATSGTNQLDRAQTGQQAIRGFMQMGM